MKRSKALWLLLLVSCVLLRSAPSRGDTCAPRGALIAGTRTFYDHIANGEPGSAACWSLLHAVFVTGQTSCGSLSPTYNAFQFNDSSFVSQLFTIPIEQTSQQFSFTFSLDFLDRSNHGGQNYVVAEVVDGTTGQVLSFYRHDGTMGSVACQRVDLTLQRDLSGHTIQVRFTSQRRDATTFIRVYGMAFFQGPL
jgi:hypothetical protein